MRKVLSYHVPESVSEAVALLAAREGFRVLAGGSSVNREKTGEYALVDLRKCGLNYIKNEEGTVKFGAMTTITEMRESPAAGILGRCFSEALKTTAHAVARNQITIGGSLACLYPWFNLAAPLMLMDASLKVHGSSGEEQISFADYIKENPREYLKARIITELSIPVQDATRQGFFRMALTEVDYGPVFAATSCLEEGGTVRKARIALSGCLAKPVELKAGTVLEGNSLTEELALEAGKKVLEQLPGELISANPNFSPAYIRKIIPAAVAGALLGGAE